MTDIGLFLLAEILTDELRKHCADPSPLRDESETNLVEFLHRAGGEHADLYVARRITHALRRLRDQRAGVWQTGDVVLDGLIVLGGFAYLRDLQTQVAA